MTTNLDLAQFVPYRLSIASNAISDLIAREYRSRFGLKIPEWRVMAVIGQDGAMTQRDLVDVTLMDKVTVSRATATLVDRALLTRSPSSRDGRSHLLCLSAAGAELYRTIVPAALAIEQRVLAVLDADERAALLQMLGKLQANVAAMKGQS